MMTRRDWLIRVFGTVAAATVAPLVDLTDTTAAFWNQEPIQKLLWRIAFPDGTMAAFNARVIAETILADGSVQFTVKPTGPLEISKTHTFPLPEPKDGVIAEAPLTPTVLTRDGEALGEIKPFQLEEIELPSLDRLNYEELDDGSYVTGIKRMPTLTFTGKWME